MSEREITLLRQFTRTRDAEAFSEITRRYADLVYSTCLRVTGDAEHARDATQDTFFQLLKQAGRITDSLGGWLHSVATRRATDLIRRDRSRRERERAFAADAVQSADAWAEVSPLVDEAMTELEPAQRDLLLRHFLQRESTVQMAAAEGVSQPTMSRRVEAALEHLRERLRQKGVAVATAALGAMMAGATQEAPAIVLTALGKVALVATGAGAAGTATTTVLGLNVKLAVAMAVAVVGVGGYVAYRSTRPAENTPPVAITPLVVAAPAPTPEPTATAAGSQAAPPTARSSGAPDPTTMVSTDQAPISGIARPLGFGGLPAPGNQASADAGAMPGSMAFAVVNSGPPPTRGTTEGALTLLAMALVRGNLAGLEECFAGAAEAEAFRRLWENPTNDAEREFQQVLKSVGPRIEVGESTATEEGLKVKWIARVRQPFTTSQDGITKIWQRGDRFELTTVLKQFGNEWKIVRF